MPDASKHDERVHCYYVPLYASVWRRRRAQRVYEMLFATAAYAVREQRQ